MSNDHIRPEMKHGVHETILTTMSIATVLVIRRCLALSTASLRSYFDTEASGSVELIAAAVVVVAALFMLEEVDSRSVLIGPTVMTRDLLNDLINEAYAVDITIEQMPRPAVQIT